MDFLKKAAKAAAEWSREEDRLQKAYNDAEDRDDSKAMSRISDQIKRHHERRPFADRLRHPLPGYDRG